MKKEKGQNPKALTQNDKRNGNTPTPPMVTGQCAEILNILRKGPTLSLTLTADYAIPETAARIHDLREKGFDIDTQIQEIVQFRGRVRKGVALYVLGCPEWPRSGFFSDNDLPPVA